MSAYEEILGSAGKAAPWSYRRTVTVPAASVALLLSACLIGYAVVKNSAKVDNQTFGSLTELAGGPPKYESDHKCYAVTDNKCSICDGFLMKCCDGDSMKCDGGKCLCTDGCAGVDGKCWNGKGNRNKKVNKAPFKITNKHWDNYDMYCPDWAPLSLMRTARFCTSCVNFYFNLHKLPGGHFMGHQLYFLTLEAYPDWTVSIQITTVLDYSSYGLYAVDMAKQMEPQEIAVHVCCMKNLGVNAVKIGRTFPNGHTVWAHLHHLSVFVYGWDTQADTEEPRDQRYWMFNETDIYDEFENCTNV